MSHIKRRSFSKIRLYKKNEPEFFTTVVSVGSTYKYSPDDYMFNDVKTAAKQYGITVRYNTGGSTEFRMYGSFNFTVMAIEIPNNHKTSVLFDVAELAI